MNEQFKQFKPFPVNDSHHHIEDVEPIEKTTETFRQLMDFFGYDRILLLALHDWMREDGCVDPTNSMRALYEKQALQPRVYAFAGLQHFGDQRDTPQGYREQLRRAWEMGFDGLKMWEEKPGMRKKLGYALDSALFEPLFAYAEEQGVPITLHAADPLECWDLNGPHATYFRSRNWLCDESFPPRHQIYQEIEGVMRRHPRLRLCLAHLSCDGESVEAATRFLSDYPNTAYDLTPSASVYKAASRDPRAWREFFLRFADRLLYGTDMYNVPLAPDGTLKAWGLSAALLSRRSLEESEPFVFQNYAYTPLHLPDAALQKIYVENFTVRLGERPRAIVPERARAECARLADAIRAGEYGARLGDERALHLENLKKAEKLFG